MKEILLSQKEWVDSQNGEIYVFSETLLKIYPIPKGIRTKDSFSYAIDNRENHLYLIRKMQEGEDVKIQITKGNEANQILFMPPNEYMVKLTPYSKD